VHPLALALVLDARDPTSVARFWAGVLGRRPVVDSRGTLLPGSDGQLALRFVAGSAPKQGRDRMHLHLTSSSRADQEHTVAVALDLGAEPLDVGQRPDEGHVVLADPEGNELCVIEPGNSFLAGCGFLGEVACEGTRDVGMFWADALGWPLVWDHDGETAVQHPVGGTKVAWGGPPVAPRQGTTRQRFDVAVAADDVSSQVMRLTALGAARLGHTPDGAVRLADPDGNEFWLSPT
jgi:catechol 2,3-dioxygenase-like lactoylglutathione lyase family enzyme